MNLRSGTYYRSGQQTIPEDRSKASTLGSKARTPNPNTQVNKRIEEETLSGLSMATSSSVPPTGLELEYVWKLRFLSENSRGALIYKDFIN